jgi:2'-hydroxyisoflavone reductase
MVSRRRFLTDVAHASAALSIGGAIAAAPSRLNAAPRRSGQRILILGGTGFLGPHIVHETVSRGHTVSIFTRGRREPSLYEDDFAHVEHLIGDREVADGYAALQGRSWDAVIETSGYRHPWTRDAVRALAGATRQYVYISSTGVFYPYRTVDIAEDGPILLADDPPQEQPSYGVMKALSEHEVRRGFGDGATIVRPGYIVGPGDTSDRWTYWPVRIARGGEILVPGRMTDPVQYIDVRDLITWIVRLIEGGVGGTFNAVGPARPQTMAEFVHGVAAVTSVPLSWTWIEDYEWLKAYPLRTAADGTTSGLAYAIPWVMPEGDALGHMRIDGRKAHAAGLSPRALADTARDTLAWRLSDAVPQALRDRPRYVLTAEQETAILTAWRERTGG